MSEARILAYGEDLEAEIAGLAALLGRDGSEGVAVGARWVAIALLEGDREVECRWGDPGGDGRVGAAVAAARRRLAERGVDDVELAVVAARYGWANEVARATVATDGRRELRDRVDGLLLSRGIGIPLFLLGMYLVFSVTTGVSGAFLDWIDATMGGPVTHLARALLGAVGLGGTWVEGLVVDGVLVGVGTVLAFLPVLLSLYVALGILEDSGYMARAAFVMDRAMRAVGLPGKSFLPLLVGFGCNVPGVYATRTIDGERSRLRTGLLVPFMSCGARLPVYVLVAAALFPRRGGLVVLAMYLLGLLVALGIGALLRHVVPSRDADAVVVLELPPYRLPSLRAVWRSAWNRTRAFLRDAGTIILATTLVVWVLMAVPRDGGAFGSAVPDDSAFGVLAGGVAPLLRPLGFGTPEAAGALLSGFVAKEVVVSTLAQAYGVGPGPVDDGGSPGRQFVDTVRGLGRAVTDAALAIPAVVGLGSPRPAGTGAPPRLVGPLRAGLGAEGGHGALAGLAFMIFVLLYTPCMATVAAERREFGWRWAATSIVGQTLLAWGVAFVVYRVGLLLGWG